MTTLTKLVLIVALFSFWIPKGTFAQTKPAVELEGAIAKEQVNGDLKAAIAAYQQIAAESSAPRDVRAKALLHLAGCYEKLGQQQSRKVYEQIVRDFGDQPSALQARARLAALEQSDRRSSPAAMIQRKIEIFDPDADPSDTDGRRVLHLRGETGELINTDLTRHRKRVIFRSPAGRTFYLSLPSKDFSMVLLAGFSRKVDLNTYLPDREVAETIAVVNVDGSGYREIAHLNTRIIARLNWSWDSRYILVLTSSQQEGMYRLLKISTADGRVRELLTLKETTGWLSTCAFSPDGRFVAYKLTPPHPGQSSSIFVLPADGGDPQQVYEEIPKAGYSTNEEQLRFFDWTVDGHFLALASDRAGRGALYLLPIRDGKTGGPLILVKYGDFRNSVLNGSQGHTTASGKLIYRSVKAGGFWSVYLAPLDSAGRLGEWKRLNFRLSNTIDPGPKWSSDSERISYISRNGDTGENGNEAVHVYNVSSGEDRELDHTLGYTSCDWAVQEPKLFCTDEGEKTEIFSIAVDSTEVLRLRLFPTRRHLWITAASLDSRALYVRDTLGDGGRVLLRWEIATSRETVVSQDPPNYNVDQSPDERWLFRVDGNLRIRPVSGGDWKTLVSLSEKVGGYTLLVNQANATRDGKWMMYHDVDSAGKHSLFRVSTAGGAPQRLGDFPSTSAYGKLEMSPDGSKIMISAGDLENGYELWSLENFVPPVLKKKE